MTAVPATTHVLYLHGFRSSPHSTKARLVGQRVQTQHPQVHWWCPALPASPKAAMAQIQAEVADWPRETSVVIGSSLGGFYARVLAEQAGWRSVLLNPAVHPDRDLQRHIGEHPAWHYPRERVFFQAEFIDELKAMADLLPPPTHTKGDQRLRHWAIVAQGDEVLDWQEMVGFCAHATVRLLPGSDHALSDFEDHIDDLFAFLNLTP